ncbi:MULTISPECIES: YncE family protein [unclassified Shinella]|uniref:YncE family protein n=1 Tax=unclassified Shinella TaxID=2643062 RepID=UPI00234EA0DF|nr:MULTISPECIES: hypothetical protein [unclassified Shinella]MCO5152602.1 hypothetical protein [Shinella sp.]MDC7261897.1 hypothetical protein [Shinella sp. HY16]MDC7268792.1 hypothetical protein [Shinella sp. YZ44]
MPRIRHTGGHSSILTAKAAGGATYEGAAFQPLTLVPRFNVGGTVASPRGLYFKPDGTRFYVLRSSDDTIHEFRLAKKWRVDSAVYVGSAVLPSMGTVRGLTFKPDGTALYVTDDTATAWIRQYSLSTPWDISTVAHVGAIAVSAQGTTPSGLAFKPDGSKLICVNNNNLREYTLSTPWLISSASHTASNSALSPEYSVAISPDGTKAFHTRVAANSIADFSFVTPWVMSAGLPANPTVLLISGVREFHYREDGKALFAMDVNGYLNQFGGV